MKKLFKLILLFSLIFNVACKEATQEVDSINVSEAITAICWDEFNVENDEAIVLDYSVCKEVSLSNQVESLQAFCGQTEIITNGMKCSDVMLPDEEYGKCVNGDSSETLVGLFIGVEEGVVADLLSVKQLDCISSGGVWEYNAGQNE